jgi:hypothetical protein
MVKEAQLRLLQRHHLWEKHRYLVRRRHLLQLSRRSLSAAASHWLHVVALVQKESAIYLPRVLQPHLVLLHRLWNRRLLPLTLMHPLLNGRHMFGTPAPLPSKCFSASLAQAPPFLCSSVRCSCSGGPQRIQLWCQRGSGFLRFVVCNDTCCTGWTDYDASNDTWNRWVRCGTRYDAS